MQNVPSSPDEWAERLEKVPLDFKRCLSRSLDYFEALVELCEPRITVERLGELEKIFLKAKLYEFFMVASLRRQLIKKGLSDA